MPIDIDEYNEWAKTVDAPCLKNFLSYKTRSIAGKQNINKRWNAEEKTVSVSNVIIVHTDG